MDIISPLKNGSIYIATKTKFGYKIKKINNIINLDNYNIIESGNDEYYLEEKIDFKKIGLTDIKNYDFNKCKIIECIINNGKQEINTLNKLLVKIYQEINSKELITKNTKLSTIQLYETDRNNYINIKKLKLSYMKPNDNLALNEIINHCEINKISLELKIELYNKQTNNYQIKIKI